MVGAFAGSRPKRALVSGTMMPIAAPISMFATIAPAITGHIARLPDIAYAKPPAMIPPPTPIRIDTVSSFCTSCRTFDGPMRPSASARMISVIVWLPELPPMPAMIDIRNARITICPTVASKRDAMNAAVDAVTRFSSSHGARLRIESFTGAKMSSSSRRPAADSCASSDSSRITSTTSFTVRRPINRPTGSTTGADTRS